MRMNVTFIAIAGFCTLVLGLLCSSFIFPKLETYLIAKATAMEEGSKAFETWKKIPFPFKFKIYFFNVTNPDDVQSGSKPVLKEMGPYIYDEFREKEVLAMSEENDTIKYIQRKSYYFKHGESGCRSDDDIVTIINFAVVSMAHKINKISPMALPMLNDAIPYLYPGLKNVFITNSVRNILFDGLQIMCDSEEVDLICGGLSSNPPHTMRRTENNRDFLLSLFHHVNETDDGPYEIVRGLQDTINKGKVVSFKDNNVLTQWSNNHCNEIRGTDLTINPSFSEVPKEINFFVPDFCRYFSVQFHKEMDYLGLNTYHFATKDIFESKENCFCNSKKLSCPPSGTMNLGPCSGSPIVLSQPHFFGAEKFLLGYSQGLEPNMDKHGTSIIMEPKTGLALLVKVRFQMNTFLKSYESVDVLRNVSEGFFPFIWFENGVTVPQKIIDEIQSNFNKLQIFDVVKYLLIVAGIVLLGFSIILALFKDKILKFCLRKNTISAKTNQIGKSMDMYSDLNMNIGVLRPARDNMGGYAWKITE